MLRPHRSPLVVAAWLTLACAPRATNPPSAAEARTPLTLEDPFPEPAVLEEIAARPRPAPEQLFERKLAVAETWTLLGPGATETADRDYVGADPSAKVLASVAARDPEGRRVTAGMQCFAEELGRFLLAHGDPPAADIEAFIAGRCGTTVTQPAFQAKPSELFPPDGLVLPRDRDGLDTLVASLPAGTHMGLWLGREGDRTMQVFAFGVPEVELDPVPLASGAHGFVELRGRLRWEPEVLRGQATTGALGFHTCQPLPGVTASPPAFALRCPVSPQDELAVIELHAVPRGRLLGRTVARVIVSPRGSVPNTHRAPVLSLPVSAGEHDQTAMVTAINALRRRADLSPVSAAVEQTTVVERLLPHLVAAVDDPGQAELGDQIALGLVAGWKVDGNVRSGRFILHTSSYGWSLERELAAQLSSPITRSQLLDPDTSTVAYAEIADSARGMRRSILASYRLFSDRDYSPEIGAFFDLVDRQRVARGLEPVVRVEADVDRKLLQRTAARVRDGDLDPSAAMDELLEHYAEQNHRSFQGLMLHPYELEGWAPELEGDLVTARSVAAAVTVSHWSPPGSAWGRQLVLVVFTVL